MLHNRAIHATSRVALDISCYESVVAGVLDYLDVRLSTPFNEPPPEPLAAEFATPTLELLAALRRSHTRADHPAWQRASQPRGAVLGEPPDGFRAPWLPETEVDALEDYESTVQLLTDPDTSGQVTPKELTRLHALLEYLEFAAYRAAQARSLRGAMQSRRRVTLR